VEVIGQFLGGLVLIVGDTEFEFAFLGAQDDGLAVHAADHVEGGLGLAAQGQFQEVVLDAFFEGLAQLGLNGEEAVGRAESGDALVGPLVVVVFDPELDALAGGLEALELGADQELLPDGGPEALDLAQGHGVMGAGLDMGDAVFLEFGGEAAGAPPGGVLAAVVGEHLARGFELGDGDAIDLDDGLGGGAAEEVGSDQVAGVVIEEGDEVGIAAAQPESEDVRLPHLVGGGPLEEARAGDIALFLFGRGRHELGLLEALAHGAGAGRQEEPAAQQLGDALDAEGGVGLLESQDLLRDGGGELLVAGVTARPVAQAGHSFLLVALHPVVEALGGNAHLPRDEVRIMVLAQVELHGLVAELRTIGPG
jgi:hypothetical protein